MIPNEEKRDYYRIVAEIKNVIIEAEIHLGNKTLFITNGFELKKFTECAILLNSAEIGVASWNRFYNIQDFFYVLFFKTYYIFYRNPFVKPEPVLFRTADVTKMYFIGFQTISVQGKLFLVSKRSCFEVETKQNIISLSQNQFTFRTVYSKDEFTVSFYLQNNRNKEFLLTKGNSQLNGEMMPAPSIQKLISTEKRAYLFRERDLETTIFIPTYFFGEKLEISKLVVPFLFITEKAGETIKIGFIFRVYNFGHNENHFWMYLTKNYYFFINHFVENRSIVFKVILVVDILSNSFSMESVKILKLENEEKMGGIFTFLNGAIIYEQNTEVDFIRSDPDTKKQEIKPVSGKGFKNDGKRRKIKVVVLILSLVLLNVFLLLMWVYPKLKKKKNIRKRIKNK